MDGDSVHLSQILINLCTNGLKWASKRSIMVVSTFDDTEKMLKVAVIDDGNGMKQEEKEQLQRKLAE